MKKITILLLGLLLVSNLINAQSLLIDQNGFLQFLKPIDAAQGAFANRSPRININSASTMYYDMNTALNLFNTNTTANNWLRVNFCTKQTDGVDMDVVGLATQYRNKNATNLSGDFHILTSNRGTYDTRFAILSTIDANHVRFNFKTGYGGGIYIDNSGGGQPTICPVLAGGYGYLGTQSNYWFQLYVDRAHVKDHIVFTSDGRKKKDIHNIESGVMSKVNKLRPVKYKWNDEEASVSTDKTKKSSELLESTSKQNIDLSNVENYRPAVNEEELQKDIEKSKKIKQKDNEKEQYGFIAQELKEVFPDMVTYDSVKDEYGVMYTALIPVIIEALKEQQTIINQQNDKISSLEYMMGDCCSKVKEKNTKSGVDAVSTLNDAAQLYQNTPNPFSYETKIRFFIPKNTNSAKIIIHDMVGNEKQTINISTLEGEGEVLIKGAELNAGLYLYSLVVNNQLVDTKKMLLTK